MTAKPQDRFPWPNLLIILLIALLGRVLLLASGSVSFHSDEAVVGLMARHIAEGARPTFFYGQAYMGSLDAWLVALGNALLGESVITIRIVQSILYLLVVGTGFLLAWTISASRLIATVAGLLLAVPTVNTALYTTATLGGYNELLLLGNLILILSFSLVQQPDRASWRWAALGLIAGLGFWSHGLIVVYCLAAGGFILWQRRRNLIQLLPYVGLALVTFFIGSAPWWIYDFSHDHLALQTLLGVNQRTDSGIISFPYVPPAQRAIGLLVFGLPALVGLRFPWESVYFLLPLGLLVVLIYALAVLALLRGTALKPGGRLIILLMFAAFALIFVASNSGADPTGRYFLPLVLPLAIMAGVLVDNLIKRGLPRLLPLALLAVLLAYQALGQGVAARSETGLTTQFNLVTHLPNDYDAELIAFLDSEGLLNGYSSYWLSFRLAYLSDEWLQYSARLPYKADMSYNAADQRYAPYEAAVAGADRVAFITANLPELDARLEALFAGQALSYAHEEIGPYRIYYDFAPERPQFDPAMLQ